MFFFFFKQSKNVLNLRNSENSHDTDITDSAVRKGLYEKLFKYVLMWF